MSFAQLEIVVEVTDCGVRNREGGESLLSGVKTKN